MAYGPFDVWMDDVGLWASGHPSGYKEDRVTGHYDVTGLLSTDVSIQCALTGFNVETSGINDRAVVGIRSFVEDGKSTTFDTNNEISWLATKMSFGITWFRVGYVLSANGGWMSGSWSVQFWRDSRTPPTKKQTLRAKLDAKKALRSEVVYDPTDGSVRHVGNYLDLSGPIRPDVAEENVVDVARALGHDGDLETIRVGFEELDQLRLGTGVKVDLSTGSLITDVSDTTG